MVKAVKKRSSEFNLKEGSVACKVCDTMICRLKVLKLKRANEGITEIESSLINLFDVELEDLKED